jgi:hypothetical protein
MGVQTVPYLKCHDERFETEEEVRTWLNEAGIEHTRRTWKLHCNSCNASVELST